MARQLLRRLTVTRRRLVIVIDRRHDVADGGVARRVIDGADVERQFATARDDVDQPVRHRDLADRADEVGDRDSAARPRGRFPPPPRRHRGASPSAPCRRVRRRRCTVMRKRAEPAIEVTMPTGKVVLQQHRSLLDMDFQIAAQGLRRARQRLDGVKIDAFLAQHGREADAVGVAPRQRALVEAAGDGAAAEIRRGEAHAFFFGKRRSRRDETARRCPLLCNCSATTSAGENAEAAVELAGIGDRVVVRADDQSLCCRIGARRNGR